MKTPLVTDVMTRVVETVRPWDSLSDAVAGMSQNDLGGVPVVEGGRVVGVVSRSNLGRVLSHPTFGSSRDSGLRVTGSRLPRVGALMSSPPVTIRPDATVWEAAGALHRGGFQFLVVVDEEGRLIGAVSRATIIRAVRRQERAPEVEAGVG